MITAEVFLQSQGKLGVIWNYDEPSVYKLELFKNSQLVTVFADSLNWKVGHYLIMEGLVNNSYYQIIITARDLNGNLGAAELNAHIERAAQAQPPVIADLLHESVNGELRITWITNVRATAELRWGRKPADMIHLVSKKLLNSEHTIILNNVSLNDPIFYQVHSCIIDGETCREWSDVQSYVPTTVGENEGADNKMARLIHRAYPNPFNDQVTIAYGLLETSSIRICIKKKVM
ncbi:MAG: hypothetical protein KBA26_13270 [Candidatus Delongbacteria bacterium]|nr:hypothetical protein [Candidatus Delongbacteria bacterium]